MVDSQNEKNKIRKLINVKISWFGDYMRIQGKFLIFWK